MNDFIDYRHLTHLVIEGVRRSARALRDRGDMPRVVSYALVPNDELESVFDASCTREVANAFTDPFCRFSPVEWPAFIPGEHLKEANALLRRRVELDNEGDFFTQNDRAFEALVQALAGVRAQRLFADDVFFTICVPDADQRRENDAIPRLNPPQLVREWRGVRLEGARQRLALIRSRPEPLSFADQDAERALNTEIAVLEEGLRAAT